MSFCPYSTTKNTFKTRSETLHDYVYVANNAINAVDPSGEIFTIAGLMTGISAQGNLRTAQQREAAQKIGNVVSVLCKNISQVGRTAGHHPFPVFLGGSRTQQRGQNLLDLDVMIHQQFHSLLSFALVLNGLPSDRGRGNGRPRYERLFNTNRSDWREALRVLRDVSQFTDNACSHVHGYRPIAPEIDIAIRRWGAYQYP